MSEWYGKAKEKIERESKEGKYDRCASAMKEEVKKALLSFVRQDEELAQAVVQGGSFSECMGHVATGCGSHISDLTAFEKAVQFYFPGARVRYRMEVDLIGDAAGGETIPQSAAVTAEGELPQSGKRSRPGPPLKRGADRAGKMLDLSDFL